MRGYDCSGGNLVDFFEVNELWTQVQAEPPADTKEGEAGADTDAEVAAASYRYTVTAAGMVEDSRMLVEMYRQFCVAVLQGGASAGPLDQQRYAKAKMHFAGMLGINDDKKAEIGKEIGSTVYGNFVGDLLQRKGSIEQQDMQQLVQIQQQLDMDEEYAVGLLWAMKKDHLRKVVDAAFSQNNELTGPVVQGVKDAADALGVDLVDDMEIAGNKMMQLFLAEVTAAISSGLALESWGKEAIEGIQESWGIANDVASDAFGSMVKGKCEEACQLAGNAQKMGDSKKCVRMLEVLGTFGSFADSVEGGLSVEVGSPRVKAKMLELYGLAKDGEEDEAEKAKTTAAKKVLEDIIKG